MSTLLLGQNFAGEAPQDEGDVRSTITVVDNESPTPVADRAPEFNTAEHDPDTEGGLTTRVVSDFVHGSERYRPIPGNANTDFAAPVNNHVSDSGTAAQRESAGEWGHGTARYSEALEPVIRKGTEFDDTYFDAGTRRLQDGTMDYMTATRRPDDSIAAGNQQDSRAAARAATAAAYSAFLSERTGQ